MIALEIDASAVEGRLAVTIGSLSDLSAPLDEVMTSALADATAAIEGAGAGLEPMSDFTPIVARVLYGKDRNPASLLIDEGRLLASLIPGQPGNILEITPAEAVGGSSLPVASWQQKGTSRTFHILQGKGFSEPGIPPRPFLYWRPEKFEEYAGIFAAHIRGEAA